MTNQDHIMGEDSQTTKLSDFDVIVADVDGWAITREMLRRLIRDEHYAILRQESGKKLATIERVASTRSEAMHAVDRCDFSYYFGRVHSVNIDTGRIQIDVTESTFFHNTWVKKLTPTTDTESK